MSQEIATLEQIQKMGEIVCRSGLFGIKTVEQAQALMLIAQAEGRHPATVAQDYDIIQGRPALKASACLARFQAAGGKIQWTCRTDERAAAKFSHEMGGEVEIEWTIARATKAGLTSKDNWKKSPAQMLAARVTSEGVRAVFPMCLNNMYTPEELKDESVETESVQGVEVVKETGKPSRLKAKIVESQTVESAPVAPVEAVASEEPEQTAEVIDTTSAAIPPETKISGKVVGVVKKNVVTTEGNKILTAAKVNDIEVATFDDDTAKFLIEGAGVAVTFIVATSPKGKQYNEITAIKVLPF